MGALVTALPVSRENGLFMAGTDRTGGDAAASEGERLRGRVPTRYSQEESRSHPQWRVKSGLRPAASQAGSTYRLSECMRTS